MPRATGRARRPRRWSPPRPGSPPPWEPPDRRSSTSIPRAGQSRSTPTRPPGRSRSGRGSAQHPPQRPAALHLLRHLERPLQPGQHSYRRAEDFRRGRAPERAERPLGLGRRTGRPAEGSTTSSSRQSRPPGIGRPKSSMRSAGPWIRVTWVKSSRANPWISRACAWAPGGTSSGIR